MRLLVFIYFISCVFFQNVCAEKLQNYLEKQYDNVKREVDFNTDFKGNIHLGHLQTFRLSKLSQGIAFPILNKTYFVNEENLFIISNNNISKYNSFLVTTPSFIKSIDRNDNSFMLVSLENGDLTLHSIKNDRNSYIQTFSNPGIPSDAEFFTLDSNLYLVITYNKNNSLVPTIMYKWLGTYFDEIIQFYTQGAKKVVTFAEGGSQVLIILQDLEVLVYQFNSGHLRKVQKIFSDNARHILPYKLAAENYVIVLEEEIGILFKYTNNGLIKWSSIENMSNVNKLRLVYYENKPIIFAIQTNKLLVFTPTINGVNLILDKKFDNFGNLLDIQVTQTLKIFTYNNEMFVTTIPFSVTFSYTEHPEEKMDELLNCMYKLEDNLRTRPFFKKINARKEEPVIFSLRNNVGAAFLPEFQTKTGQDNAKRIQNTLKNLNEKIREMQPRIDNFSKQEESKSFDHEVIIKGKLYAKEITIHNLNIEKVNNFLWTPEEWLSYSKNQIIPGPVSITNLFTKNLQLPHNSYFDDILRQNGNQKLTGKNSFRAINATKVFTEMSINDVQFGNIYLKSNPMKIRGIKKLHSLEAHKISTDKINGLNSFQVIRSLGQSKSHNFTNLIVKNLVVNEINGVHWNTFKDSVFKFNTTTRINDNIKLTNFKSNHLYVTNLNDVPVNQILTTTTNQTITSTIIFENINARRIQSENINGLNMSEDIVTSAKKNQIIRGPVRIDNLKIRGNVYLNYTTDKIKSKDVLGTKISDLHQFYHKKVKILGNLRLKNLKFASKAKLSVDGNNFDTTIFKSYWSKTKRQVIPTHVSFLRGAQVPHLSTVNLNGYLVSNYLLTNLEDQGSTKFIFNNIAVFGNINLNQSVPHFPNLKWLEENSVKYTGRFVVKNKKKFVSQVRIKKLTTKFINHTKTEDLLTTKSTGRVLGNKTFENVVVSTDFLSPNATVYNINGINLSKLKNDALYVDEPLALNNELSFSSLAANNLTVTTMNGIDFENYTKIVNEVYSISTLNHVEILGNLTIFHAHYVNSMNNISVRDILTRGQNDDKTFLIEGNIKLLGDIYTKNFDGMVINNINFKQLTEKLLYRIYNQNITARYHFNYVTAHDLFADSIKNISLKNLIDIQSLEPQEMYFNNTTLELAYPKFSTSLRALRVNCNLHRAVTNIQNPSRRSWTEIITTNATIVDDESALFKIVNNAVFANNLNTITAPVKFSNELLANNVYLNKNINGVNMTELIEDMVFKSEKEQIIGGYKRFPRLSAKTAIIYTNADVSVINGMSISQINNSIIDVNNIGYDVIRGKKAFLGGLQTERFYGKKISDVDFENFVNIKNLKAIPSAAFNQISANNLDVTYLNNMDVMDILSKRLLRQSSEPQVAKGIYYFDSIYLNGDSVIRDINGIPIEDFVVDEGMQAIEGEKTFKEIVNINRNIYTGHVNNLKISELYKNSVLINEDLRIEGNIHLNQAQVFGPIYTENINGMPVSNMMDMLNRKTESLADNVNETVAKIEEVVIKSLNTLKSLPDKYMHLEKYKEFPVISSSEIVDARVALTGNDILIHVQESEDGPACGLPNNCSCPTQTTMRITPEFAISGFQNPGFGRLFNYELGNGNINLVAKGISFNSHCRINVSNENSDLTWDYNSETTTYSNNITGYVSGVEFFTLKGVTYTIICRYYDPVYDTHDLGCMLMKFSKEMDKVDLLQIIPVNGPWMSHLFHTAQGITLVIGQILPTSNETAIYRFDVNQNKFILLRTIKSLGCTSAAGVVLNFDSLIILANNRERNIHIYKYESEFNNYYYYQDFHFDSPVLTVVTFYLNGFGISDAYLCTVTENGNFYVYSFKELEGWKLESSSRIDGLRTIIPFELNKNTYLYALSSKSNSILTIVKHSF